MSIQQSYAYQPLPPNNYRLLELELNGVKEPLKGRLVNHAVGHAPPYLCLSYSWGTDRQKRHSIDIQGNKLPITGTIFTILHWIRAYRRDEKTDGDDEAAVLIWIDSICISQEDIMERAEQVQHMKRIFSEAELVIVYLGEQDRGSEKIPELFKKIHTVYQKWSNVEVPQGTAKTHLRDLSVRELDGIGLPPRGDPVWRAYRAFMSRDWFLRTWIIQEAVLARKILWVCGNWGFDGEGLIEPWHIMIAAQFPHTLTSVDEMTKTHDPVGRAMQQVLLMLNLGMGTEDKKSPSLGDLLQTCRQALATDPRDYLYGVLGLASSPYRHNIVVDYQESVEDTYIRVAETIVDLGDGAKLLYNIHGLESELDLPSWVPDWSAQRVPFFSLAPALGSASATFDIPYVCAGGQSSEMRVLHDRKALCCKGYILDVIDRLTEIHADGDDDDDDDDKNNNNSANAEQKTDINPPSDEEGLLTSNPTHGYDALIRCLSEMSTLLKTKSAYEPSTHEEVIWRTAIWNRGASNQSKASPSYSSLYTSFKNFVKIRSLSKHGLIAEYRPKWHALDKELGFIVPGDVGAKITIQQSILEEDRAVKFANWANTIRVQMRRCGTKKGYLGHVPKRAEVGDAICVIAGAAIPFTVRRNEKGEYTLIGQCYLHGFMEGEALNHPDLRTEDIILV